MTSRTVVIGIGGVLLWAVGVALIVFGSNVPLRVLGAVVFACGLAGVIWLILSNRAKFQ